MTRVTIAILTVENDLHALAVQHALAQFEDVTCLIIETDRISGSGRWSWLTKENDSLASSILSQDGRLISADELDVVWWRRTSYPQRVPSDVEDPTHLDLINNDCAATVLGVLITTFGGIWINDPVATRMAENKLVQLEAAKKAGLTIPRTLVSNDPSKIRQFCDSLNNQVVVKPVRGTTKCHLFTRVLVGEHLASSECVRLSPAMYQELITGREHLRVHCFGDSCEAVLIQSEAIDWRQNLDIPFSPFSVTKKLTSALLCVLRNLGLRMGVVDIKLSNDATPIWLEVNPQGQFLFSEGLSGLDLTSSFARFLYQQALSATRARVRRTRTNRQGFKHNSADTHLARRRTTWRRELQEK